MKWSEETTNQDITQYDYPLPPSVDLPSSSVSCPMKRGEERTKSYGETLSDRGEIKRSRTTVFRPRVTFSYCGRDGNYGKVGMPQLPKGEDDQRFTES